MKKYLKRYFIITIVFLSIFSLKGYVVQASPVENTKNSEVEQLYDYITNMKNEHELLKDMDAKSFVSNYMKKGEGGFSVNKFIKAITTYMLRELIVSLKLMTTLIIISIVCALITNLEKAFSNEQLSNIAYFACYALLIVIMSRSFYVGVQLARETITRMSDFMLALVPVLIMLLVGIGGVAEAAVMDPVVIGAVNISARIFSNILIPLISATFVLQFVNNMTEEFKIEKLTKLLNQVALWGQGILMTIFIGIMTVRGISSKTLDQVVAKTAKYAVDNFVPIVGKCLSDAISTVAGYSLLLKNALSSVGLIVLILIVILPIIKIALTALLYKITAALIEPIAEKRLVNSITSAGDSLILITSCLICVSVMFFIMISIIATAGKMAIGG
ncbi:stage III sporulation protein AE [Clostridium sp. MSJ-11]|uniref:Stage III sporulation protein AE n=1 Tax=Clostridium mobile TaxID=2841512 RepID=A0ABS6ECM2_9CLOT|nr:stage III sporulation protein AE [Clostridium mobile]MBU5482946.1 stage III sporulation protein AE [Clostridium mobile]